MKRTTRNRIVWIVLGGLVLAAVVYGFWPDPVPVQTATVERGPLAVVVEEEGETRLEDLYVISSPTAAFARRVEREVGDVVQAGDPLVLLEPPRATPLDPRTRREATARVEAAEASLERAETLLRRVIDERERLERLVAAGSATRQALEQATTEEALAIAGRDVARAEVSSARALLEPGEPAAQPVQDVLRSPAAGRVLAVYRPSGGHVNPGEPLMEIGDVDRLEIAVNVLSQDAVRIRAGTRVLLEQWGEPFPLEAAVTRVAPQGFTTVSALGVEERRVPVVAEFVSPAESRVSLGTGYRVLARFVIWEGEGVLQVPTSALFRVGDDWAVFVVENGRAARRVVSVGRQTGLAAEVLTGIAENDVVIVHPDAAVDDGVRVQADVDPR